MTLLDWKRLQRHWRRYPTMRTMAWVGFHLERKDKAPDEVAIPIEDLLGDSPSGVIRMEDLSALGAVHG